MVSVPKFDLRCNVHITAEMAEKLDEWRRNRKRLPTRPEALRELADAGLTVFPAERIRALEAWAARQPDKPDWAEAAARLLDKALKDEAGG